MFSGGNPNSSGDGFNSSMKQYNHFTSGTSSAAAMQSMMNAAANGGNIDWGQLAQQWIQMRDANTETTAAPIMDTGNYGIMPVAPPPPIINDAALYQRATIHNQNLVEHGEADMDMDEEDQNDVGTNSTRNRTTINPLPPAPYVEPSQWHAAGAHIISSVSAAESNEIPSGHKKGNQWSTSANLWPSRVNVQPLPAQSPPIINVTHRNARNPTAHIPSLLKINVTNPNEPVQNTNYIDESTTSNSMDANKRKLLPAWIREGLEKMEREKQKQLERQHSAPAATQEPLEKANKTLATAPMKSTSGNSKSLDAHVESDSESGNEDDIHDDDDLDGEEIPQRSSAIFAATAAAASATRTQYGSDADEEQVAAGACKKSTAQQKIGKSYEQKLADLMSVVRRTLTELLLETTNEEIASVAQEAIKYQRSKASSAQVIRKSALSSITGKLGLAAYDDSSSDENSATSGNDEPRSDNEANNMDSEEELKAIIRNKRRAFAKTIEEIEESIAAAENREEQNLKYYKQLEKEQALEAQDILNRSNNSNKRSAESANSSDRTTATKSKSSGGGSSIGGSSSKMKYERDFGETTSDSKLQQLNGKRLNRKERTTRFSDNKDAKGGGNNKSNSLLAATTSYINQIPSVNMTTPNGSSSQSVATTMASNNKLQPVPNPATALLQVPESVAHYAASAASNSGMVNMLNAADAALEKAASSSKTKTSTVSSSKHKRSQRHSREDSSSSGSSSTDTTTDSSDSDSSTSKHSRTSSAKYSHRRRPRREEDHHRHSSSSKRSLQLSSRKYSRRERSRSRARESSRRHHHGRGRHYYSSDSDNNRYYDDRYRGKHERKRPTTRSRSKSRSSYAKSHHRSSSRRH